MDSASVTSSMYKLDIYLYLDSCPLHDEEGRITGNVEEQGNKPREE